MLRLIGIALLWLSALSAGATAQTPYQQREAYRTAANTYLQTCVAGLEELIIEGGLSPAWEGQSCAQVVPGMPDYNAQRPTITGSVIHLAPDTEAGYRVTVTATLGQQVTFSSPFKPHPPMLRFWPAYLLAALLSALIVGPGLLARPLNWLAPMGWVLLLGEVALAGFWSLVLLGGNGPDMALPLEVLLLGLVGVPVASGVLGLLRWVALGKTEPFWQSYGVAVLGVHVLALPALQNNAPGFSFNYTRALALGFPVGLALLGLYLRGRSSSRSPERR